MVARSGGIPVVADAGTAELCQRPSHLVLPSSPSPAGCRPRYRCPSAFSPRRAPAWTPARPDGPPPPLLATHTPQAPARDTSGTGLRGLRSPAARLGESDALWEVPEWLQEGSGLPGGGKDTRG